MVMNGDKNEVRQRKWAYVTIFLAAILLFTNVLKADFATPFENNKVGDISEATGYVVALDSNTEECTFFLVIVIDDRMQPVGFYATAEKKLITQSLLGRQVIIKAKVVSREEYRDKTKDIRLKILSVRPLEKQKVKEEVENLLSKLENLENKHLKICDEKWELMSDKEQRLLLTVNMAVKSGLEDNLKALVRETASQTAVLGEPAVPVLLKKLKVLSPESDYQRRCITLSLREIGYPSVPYLIEELQIPESSNLRTIVNILGGIRDARAGEPLLTLFKSQKTTSFNLKGSIAKALGQIGYKRSVVPIITELEKCLEYAEKRGNWDANSYDMNDYARALGKLGDRSAIPVLKRALRAGPQKNSKRNNKYVVASTATQSLHLLGQSFDEIRGRIISPDGQPLEDAKVLIYPDTIIHTNKSGLFFNISYRGLPGLIEASHNDWPGCKAISTPYLEEEKFLILVLRKTLTLKGKIQAPDSNPIGGAKIHLAIYGGSYTSSGFQKVQSTTSNENGLFVIKGLVPKNRYNLVVYAKNCSRFVSDRFYASTREMYTKDGLQGYEHMVLHPGRTITFTVLNPDGKPVQNAHITVGGKDWPYGQGNTNKNGQVAIRDLPGSEILNKQQHQKGKLHVSVQTNELWKQKEYWYEPDNENKVTIQLIIDPTRGQNQKNFSRG